MIPAPRTPTALVLARAPSARPKRGLESLLGVERCRLLQEWLLARAETWAREVAPGRAHLAVTSDGGERPTDQVVGLDQPAERLGERLSGLIGRVGPGGGPLLIASTNLPCLSVGHARAALSDLAAGWDVSFGPASDGGCYLLGLREPDPDLLARAVGTWRRTEVMQRALAVATDAGLSLGLLRSERELHSPADARALLADPTTPTELMRLLEPVGRPR